MANEGKFFPSTFQEALAILYMQNQDLTGKEPEELVESYQDAYKRICKKQQEIRYEKNAEKTKSQDMYRF